MTELNEVQPIDGYVRNLLRGAKERYNLNIGLKKNNTLIFLLFLKIFDLTIV